MRPRPDVPAVVPEEAPRDHAVNALTMLETFRDVHHAGKGWYDCLNDPAIRIADLAATLERVEARLGLVVKGLTL